MILVVAAIGTLLLAEPAMTLVHRFLFHGPFWCEHKSHHAHPTARRIVRNDRLWFWLAAALSLVLFGGPIVAGIGIGTAAYVAAYILAHDGVAHGRFWVPRVMRRMTVFRIIAHTHHLHHRGGRAGYGAPPFGVYLAPLEHRWRLLAQYTPPTKECSPALTR